MKRRTMIVTALAGAAMLALLTWAFAPSPGAVELAAVSLGRFEQAIVEDGRTRLRERYSVNAPLAGRLARITLREGVYVAVSGPSLETRAEYRMLRALGADVVGMSTVPEVIVAVQAGFRVLGLSIITDQCLPDALEPASLDRIIATATGAEPNLTALVRGVLEQL